MRSEFINEGEEKMYKACTKCTKAFYVAEGEEWKKTCLSCWKKSKGVQGNSSDRAYQRVIELESLTRVLYSRIAELERKSPTTMEPEMLRRIIMLCHPDKHNQSEASRKATQFLLDMKKS